MAKGEAMPAFRTVNGRQAGPSALGILVPPGSRTVVVVRPRSLAVDLVMIRHDPDGAAADGFFEASRQAAGLEAQKLAHALMSCAASGTGRVEVLPAAESGTFHVRAELDAFLLVVCARIPGQPYRPLVYSRAEDAQSMADALSDALFPPPDANRELYTNMSQFGRHISPSPLAGEGLG
jgi:hypothetical protein